MDLMTRPLTRKEVSDMVENDEIPFKVHIDKILALSCKNDESDDAVFDFSNKVSQLILGNTDGTVVCWDIVEEISPQILEIEGVLNVAHFLFGCMDGSEMIEQWENDCAANIAYAHNNGDLYEGKW